MYGCLGAGSAPERCNAARGKVLPVAAVLDVRLEVGTTLPLAKWLAERGVPFVFQTSDATLIDAAYLAAPVLRKPFRPEHLIAALAALLDQER